jgi:hypothetical protein
MTVSYRDHIALCGRIAPACPRVNGPKGRR